MTYYRQPAVGLTFETPYPGLTFKDWSLIDGGSDQIKPERGDIWPPGRMEDVGPIG